MTIPDEVWSVCARYLVATPLPTADGKPRRKPWTPGMQAVQYALWDYMGNQGLIGDAPPPAVAEAELEALGLSVNDLHNRLFSLSMHAGIALSAAMDEHWHEPVPLEALAEIRRKMGLAIALALGRVRSVKGRAGRRSDAFRDELIARLFAIFKEHRAKATRRRPHTRKDRDTFAREVLRHMSIATPGNLAERVRVASKRKYRAQSATE